MSSITAPNGELRISKKDSKRWDHVEGKENPDPVDWSGGIFELARAVRENRQPANSARLALHTLEALLAINEAASSGTTVHLR